jgi:type II secretory pathway component GspD/PulD (secretin)
MKTDGYMMPPKRHTPLLPITALAAILAVSTGCNLYRANKAFDEGKYEEAAHAYSRLVQQNPSNVKAKMGYKRSAVLAAEGYLLQAKEAEKRGHSEVVQENIIRALRFDPQNSVALDWLAAIEEAKFRDESLKTLDEDLRAIRNRVESEPIIKLDPKEPTLNEFVMNNQPLKQVFKVLEKHFDITFLFHNQFSQGADAPIQFSAKSMSLERILDTLALQNDLYYRYIDTKTVMVFKGGANAAQRAEFENQQYKTIYLDNAKPQDIATTLQRLLGQSQRIQLTPDNRLNAIIVKGRPNDVKLVTRMARQLDKAKAEVMVYVELLEVTESSMEQVGLMPVLSPGGEGIYKIGATIDNSGGPNINKGAIRISKEDIRFLFPSIQLDALKTSGEAKMAARQNMRIASDASATFNFGDKIFVVTGTPTTSSASSALSQQLQGYGYNNLPYGNNYQQQDVGVKIQITPRVHHNDDITLDLKSEVTSLKASANADRPDIGQRKLDTEVRMQNGETIIFGGLLREDEQKSKKGIWGLADIPLIGKLVSNNRKDISKTDVLLTVRCVIVRKPDLREEDFRPFDPDFTALQEELEAELRANRLLEARQNAERERANAAAAESTPPSPAQPPASRQTEETQTNISGAATQQQTTDATRSTEVATENKAEKRPAESDLFLFLSPITSQISTGERRQINMMVSGGRGVTSGEFVFRIDPKLKLHGVTGADFLINEGGNIISGPIVDGLITVSFQRKTAASGSGTLLTLDLEATEKGNAAIMVDAYKCFMSGNPITAQIQNALIEIE